MPPPGPAWLADLLLNHVKLMLDPSHENLNLSLTLYGHGFRRSGPGKYSMHYSVLSEMDMPVSKRVHMLLLVRGWAIGKFSLVTVKPLRYFDKAGNFLPLRR